MKLNLVPARTGLKWVRLGFVTFFNQPLALSGLFFMFMAVFALTGLVPGLGLLLGLGIVPAATLGLMAATLEATKGRFPMPSVLISAFRAGRAQAKQMAVLGAMYALGFIAIVLITAVADGGEFAKAQLGFGAPKTPKQLMDAAGVQGAMFVFMIVYVPLAAAFWHAPALVHWHGVSPTKSLFFSLVACWRNKAAMVVYLLGWLAVMVGAMTFVLLLTTLLGGPQLGQIVMVPTTLLLASMFFVSMYFTYADTFSPEGQTHG